MYKTINKKIIKQTATNDDYFTRLVKGFTYSCLQSNNKVRVGMISEIITTN